MIDIGQIAGAVQAAMSGTAATGATVLSGLPGSTAASEMGPVPFADVLRSMAQQTSALDKKAASTVTGLLNGSGVEIHDAMIATQKADMAFELALQVRNKAVGAYQQMMSMQF
jgi:flagellar hook-basal body complex protein FliE